MISSQTKRKLLFLWNQIVSEMVLLQDESPEGWESHFLNPISNSVYLRESAFGVNIFATNYLLSKDEKWLKRANRTYEVLKEIDAYQGLEEPIWSRFGWYEKPGSLPASCLFLEAYWDALDLLGENIDYRPVTLRNYLESCYIGNGVFSHESVLPGTKPHSVINTTAMALFMFSHISEEKTDGVIKLKRIALALKNGQRSDGFWPYIFPGGIQTFLFHSAISRKPYRYLSRFISLNDRSVFFGDVLHHVVTMHYVLRSLHRITIEKDTLFRSLSKGWDWLLENLIWENGNTELRINFDIEPQKFPPRFCNFRETSTYFVILGMLPTLQSLKIISKVEVEKLSNGILTHIINNLLKKDKSLPGIIAYEGKIETIRNILPRAGESVAWKGNSLAFFIQGLNICE